MAEPWEVIMKILFLTAVLTLGLGGLFSANAAEPETLVVNVGQQKTSVRGKIKVKVVEVAEDSRCPVGTTCVWAGNAKIKITLAKGKKAAKTFELNSTLDPRVIVFEGYDIRFVDLSPRPGEQVKRRAFDPCVTFSITKHVK